MRSNYIVIEGLEGAGKTTARQLVVETLQSAGIHDMVFTREPGGTILAEKLRSLVLDIQSTGRQIGRHKHRGTSVAEKGKFTLAVQLLHASMKHTGFNTLTSQVIFHAFHRFA